MWLFFLAMIINLIDGKFLHGFCLGLRPMYCSMSYYSTLILLDFYLVFVGIVVCPVCRGCVKDPRTTLHYYFV